MSHSDDFGGQLCSFFFILGILLTVGLGKWVISSHFEAQAYNNITGKNVSTWDAMFVELRVEGGSD